MIKANEGRGARAAGLLLGVVFTLFGASPVGACGGCTITWEFDTWTDCAACDGSTKWTATEKYSVSGTYSSAGCSFASASASSLGCVQTAVGSTLTSTATFVTTVKDCNYHSWTVKSSIVCNQVQQSSSKSEQWKCHQDSSGNVCLCP